MVSFIAFIGVFSVVVLVHELGHLIAARRSGVSVYEFSIGFPFSPRIVTLFRHRETVFTLRLLPLGGFVSFSNEADGRAGDLFGAPLCRRALIMSAGALFNVAFAFLIFVPVFAVGKDLGLVDAILLSGQTVWGILSGTVGLLYGLLSGKGGMDGLAGPVGIAAMAGAAAGKGFLSLLYFTGVLSMSLGVMNLLPLPALDGGQLVMLLLESIQGKPLGMKTYQAVSLAGFSLFILLTVLTTYKDIVRLIA
jgi:regulator of sigma E protease